MDLREDFFEHNIKYEKHDGYIYPVFDFMEYLSEPNKIYIGYTIVKLTPYFQLKPVASYPYPLRKLLS